MKHLFTLITIVFLTATTYSQDVNIDLSSEKLDCKTKLQKLNLEINVLLKSINDFTTKGDSISIKTALDIVNSTFKAKIAEFKLIQEECIDNITHKVELDLSKISSNILQLEKQLESKKEQLTECNDMNNNEVANSLLKELKELFANLENKQTKIDNQKAIITRMQKDSISINKKYTEVLNNTDKTGGRIGELEGIIKHKDAVIAIFKDSKSLFDTGLAFGSNFDSKGDFQYLVKNDSSLQGKQVGTGANGMVSAVVSFEFPVHFLEKFSKRIFEWSETSTENHPIPGTCKVLINVPLTETLFQNKENAIGLFNKKVALGLGFGMDILKLANGKQSLSIFYIVNFSPVTRLDMDYYSNYKFEEGYPNKIDLNNYVTYNELNTTHFIGLYLSLF